MGVTMTAERAQAKADKLLAVAAWFIAHHYRIESYRYRDSAHRLLKRYGLPFWFTADDVKRKDRVI
jgi:hypothetical protein